MDNLLFETPVNNLIEAVIRGDLDRTRFLVNNGSDVLEKDNEGHTALHFASSSGNLEIVKFLVELMSSNINDAGLQNANTNILEKDNRGFTALHCAAMHGHLEIVNYLIGSGSNVLDKTSDGGWTALHLASLLGCLEIIKLLVESGSNANINILEEKDHRGWTVLHNASYYGYLEIVKYLIEMNADIEITDSEGKTAIDLAKSEEIKVFLIEQLEIQQNSYIWK